MGKAMIDFKISIAKWDTSSNEAPEVNCTCTDIKIIVGGRIVTRNQNRWSKSTHDEVRLSAYPLALWFASSWWRLRWETLPSVGPVSSPKVSWRMAHEMTAAGYGYLWPNLLFTTDGEFTHIWSVADSTTESEPPIRYLENIYSSIPNADFEREIKSFISLVIARLDAVGIQETVLQELWKEIVDEIEDPVLFVFRKHEAMLGFEPDEAPDALALKIQNIIHLIGEGPIAEIAPVCSASKNFEVTLDGLISFANSPGLVGKIDHKRSDPRSSVLPWEKGRELAQAIRKDLNLNGDMIPNKILSDLIGMTEKDAFSIQSSKQLVGIATRNGDPQSFCFHFRSKQEKTSRRFEISRYVGDFFISNPTDKWLSLTDAKTVRQKIQRAFAAEFLCPIDSLIEFLGEEFSEDDIDNAGEHFQVSPMAITTQLVNNKYLAREWLPVDHSDCTFPYSRTTFHH